MQTHTPFESQAAEFIKEAQGVDGAIFQYIEITPEVIDALDSCKGYVRYGIGYNNIDVEHAAKRKKMVANVPKYGIDEVSNHALGLILALNRNFLKIHRLVTQRAYEFAKVRPIFRLKDSTAGIVGIGNIGSCVADKLKAMVKRIIFCDPNVDSYPGCEKVSIEEVFAESDYVSVNCLLDASTTKLVSRRLMESMKPTAYLVNTARGGIIDQDALIELLKAKKFAGAGLDVFEVEPLEDDSPLRDLDNVILTHHIAWYSEGAIVELQSTAAEQLVQILKGQTPDYSVI